MDLVCLFQKCAVFGYNFFLLHLGEVMTVEIIG
jgi:hypothetical protein